MSQTKGFTLIELMIAVAVIGILTIIALPSYRDYVTRGKIAEATSNLADLRVKLEQFFQDNRTYVGACAAGTAAPLPVGDQAKYFTYDCPTLTATAYTARATGGAGQDTAGFVYTIDQNNVKATTVTAGSRAATAGFTGNASCWVTRKGGLC